MAKIVYQFSKGIARIINQQFLSISTDNRLSIHIDGASVNIATVDGVDYKMVNNTAEVPINKQGILRVSFAFYDNAGKLINRIPAESISVFNLEDTKVFEKYISIDPEDLKGRLEGLEKENKELSEKIGEITTISTKLNEVVKSYNKLVDVVNDINERLSECEKDFDPSLFTRDSREAL